MDFSSILVEVLILALLIILNGVFAMSEIAIVSARRVQLQLMAGEGDDGAERALMLANAPTQFLSTVQVGITTVGIFLGAFGGATLAQKVTPLVARIPLLDAYAAGISLVLVVAGLTYLSVVLGELVPKRLALANAEGVARRIARPMQMLSMLARPVVRLLSLSTEALVRLLGVSTDTASPVSEEEIRVLVQEGADAGVIHMEEMAMVESVFRFGDLRVENFMTPRTDIVWLDVNAPESEVRAQIENAPHSLYPVCDGELDKLLGIVHTRDLLVNTWEATSFDLRAMMKDALVIPETMMALQALERLRASGTHVGILIDEFGGVEGLVTLFNVLEALVGDIPTEDEIDAPPIVTRTDGSLLADGVVLVDDLKSALDVRELPAEDRYQTLGGFVLLMLGKVPVAGDSFDWEGYRFEVVDMDGRRVDKVLIERSD